MGLNHYLHVVSACNHRLVKLSCVLNLEGRVVTPGVKAKPNAYSMCAQESSFHIYHTENGYIIINVTIYNNNYMINVFNKRLNRTLLKHSNGKTP
jgi:hypothetical protein